MAERNRTSRNTATRQIQVDKLRYTEGLNFAASTSRTSPPRPLARRRRLHAGRRRHRPRPPRPPRPHPPPIAAPAPVPPGAGALDFKGESPAAAEPSPDGLAATDDDAALRDLDLEVAFDMARVSRVLDLMTHQVSYSKIETMICP